jgi:hypothetical protein
MSESAFPFVVLLEDDPGQVNYLREDFAVRYPRGRMLVFQSEGEFHDAFNTRLPSPPPHLVVLDYIAKWERAGEPPNTPWESHFYADGAGARCAHIIKRQDPTIPVVIWTVIRRQIDPNALPNGVEVLQKQEVELAALIEATIRRN